ncbi:MAG: alpha/beta hydrolase [Myxococcales bacterium]|nr:alpha/beta hydrolase [Myxococcales bacterium]
MAVRRFGGGPELVWIHGLGEQSASFERIARQLAEVTHVLPDLPGYGRSPAPGPSTAAGIDSIDATADQLAAWLADATRANAPPPILIGHSLGGVLATLVAERMPVRGVINIDGNLTRGDCTFSAEAAAYSLEDFIASGFAAMRARVGERAAAEPPLRGYHAALTLADPAAFHRHAIDLVRLSSTETLAGRLAALGVPTLFVAGVPRGICEASRALLDAHRVPWIGIEPAGHWPFIDQPDAFASVVGRFLRTLG